MALDTRWKEPQGKTPEQLYDAISQVVRELRKGAFLSGVENPDADGVPYDNTTSGLTAENVQDAIDEVEGRVDDLEALPDPGLILLNSGIVTNQATLDIPLTSFTAYRGLLFKLINFLPATDAVGLQMLLSTDGGANYIATGYQYNAFLTRSGSTTSGAEASTSAAFLTLSRLGGNATFSIGNAAGEGITASVELLGQAGASFPRILADASFIAANGQVERATVTGALPTAQDTNAARFQFSSGNIASGSWALYGYA